MARTPSLGVRGIFTDPQTSRGPEIPSSALPAQSRKDILQKRQPPCQRNQKDLPGKRRIPPRVPPFLLRCCSCLKNQHRPVLGEVYTALVACAAVVLNVAAGGTDKAQRGVAARAELCLFRIFMTAFGALHKRRWWTRRDSNPRPQRCERRALPTELRAHGSYYSHQYSTRVSTCRQLPTILERV